jgi:3-hydroxy-9,10-secoandrosta-1,3,5(10)-triene-9,17-dione monooxygenase reductase component
VTRGQSTWGLEPDSATLRTVGGHFATGVTVVTALEGETPVGMACNSFTTVSLDPPLVLFCAMTSSSTWPRMRDATGFAINVLAEEGESLSRVFATKDIDRFATVSHRRGATGAPILDDALAYFDCVPEVQHDAGDHVIVVLRVVELGYAPEGKPLLFYRGGYGRYES